MIDATRIQVISTLFATAVSVAACQNLDDAHAADEIAIRAVLNVM